jgi:hypothetical protein
VAADIQKVDYNKKKNCFQIVTPERIYHIRCDREDELVDWVNSIRKQQAELLYPSQKTEGGPAPSAGAAAPVVATTTVTATPAPVQQVAIGAGMSSPTAPPNPGSHDVRVFVCVLPNDMKRSLRPSLMALTDSNIVILCICFGSP